MNGARRQLLACAAFARDEHGGAARRHLLDERKDFFHFPRGPHHLVQQAPVAKLALQPLGVLGQPSLVRRTLQ